MARVKCPKCKTEFDVVNHDSMVVPAFHDESTNVIGTLVPSKEGNDMEKLKLTQEVNFKTLSDEQKAEILKEMGFNVFDVMKAKVGDVDENVQNIKGYGYVKNQKIHRRWITAQTMHLLGWYDGCKFYDKWTENMNHRYHYFSQFDILKSEFNTLAHLEKLDKECFEERVQFFNKEVAISVCADYIQKLGKYLKEDAHVFHCKGIPYIRLRGEDVFVSDIDKRIINVLKDELNVFKHSMTSYEDNYNFIVSFMKNKFVVPFCNVWTLQKSAAWINAFKGAGAYYTMKNLVCYSGLKLINYDTEKCLSTSESLKYLEKETKKAVANCENYKLLALLKDSLKKSSFCFKDVVKK